MKLKRKNYLIFFSLFLIIFLGAFQLVWGQTADLTDPLGERDVSTLVADIIKYVLGLVGVLALAMFIYGGFLWMTSGGAVEKVKKGKETLVWAVLGLALIFFSYAILEFILKAFVKK
jgi:uncharacterized membrane protein YidH (DUF202 family)